MINRLTLKPKPKPPPAVFGVLAHMLSITESYIPVILYSHVMVFLTWLREYNTSYAPILQWHTPSLVISCDHLQGDLIPSAEGTKRRDIPKLRQKYSSLYPSTMFLFLFFRFYKTKENTNMFHTTFATVCSTLNRKEKHGPNIGEEQWLNWKHTNSSNNCLIHHEESNMHRLPTKIKGKFFCNHLTQHCTQKKKTKIDD
jgi:hypothetical protein